MVWKPPSKGSASAADMRVGAKFLRYELPTGADVEQLAAVARFLEMQATIREKALAKSREERRAAREAREKAAETEGGST